MRKRRKKRKNLLIVQSNLSYLMRRYNGVSRDAIYDWRQFLGLSTTRNKHFFDPEEIDELDRFYVAAHIPRENRRNFWGLMMGKEIYCELILDKGITLDEYLVNKFGKTYQQFLEDVTRRYGIEPFGS